MLFWLLISALAIYVVLIVVVFVFQRSLVYWDWNKGSRPQVSLESSNGQFIRIDTEDGERLVAWYSPPQDDQPIVIFFHGNGDDPGKRAVRFLGLTSAGFGVLAPYFRGCGGSTGNPTEAGLLCDAAAAYRYCADRHAPERIVLWGFSLGSAVAVLLAAKARIRALILEAPFTSLNAVAKRLLPFLPIDLILRDRYRADVAIAAVTAPILILHGEADREIPIRFGKQLFDAAPEPKQFVRISAGCHRDLDKHGGLGVVRRFLASLATTPPGAPKNGPC